MLARLALVLVVAVAACDSPGGDGGGQPVADVWGDTADAKEWAPDPECAETGDCAYGGRCTWDATKSECVASPEGCAQSTACTHEGRCEIGPSGYCGATKESCACSAKCRDEGYCLLDPGFGICTFGHPEVSCPVVSD